MSLLITGHKGFVGQHLTSLLDSSGVKWVGYDLKDGNDIRDKHKLDAFFESNQVTEVIHLAALAGVRRGEEYVQDFLSTNVEGTHNIVKMCEKYDIRHLVFYSSSSVFGEGFPPIDEGSSRNPKSIYGITKLAGEHIVHNSKIKQTTIVVPFTIYGENGRKDEVIYKWLEQYKNGLPITVYGNGSSMRGYVYVKNIVDVTHKIITKCTNEWHRMSLNIGGSEVIMLSQILDVFREMIPDLKFTFLPLPEADVYKNYADISKARGLLDYNPQPRFLDNLKNIIKNELCLK